VTTGIKGSRTVVVRVPRRGTLKAHYDVGSPYVDLAFGYSDTPYETIRVWDEAAEGPSITGTLSDVRRVVTAWVKEMDSDPAWPTWYEDILAATEQ
jgi:hypothetical protein